MCEVIAFHPFQCARDDGKRIGLNTKQAVHRVADAMRQGVSPNVAAGQIRHAAMTRAPRSCNPDPNGPRAA